MADYERILITGAAGSLGAQLREGLADLAPRLRLADRADMGVAAANEELVVCDLADRQAAFACIDGCDAIVHFAGNPREHPFDELLRDGLPAAYNIWEGARRHGVKRIVHASSIHAVGFCEVEEVPDTRVPHRPDTFYGLGKCFVEDLAALYWDKWGLETVCLRIGSCSPEPADRRMLWSWLSAADLVRLTEAALTAPRVGFSVIYGTSDNAQAAVSNAFATHIGFVPRDSADGHAPAVLELTPRPDPHARATRVIGGGFAAAGHPDDDRR
ncbi:MAG TPA: NAD(P)-dependent oxidoreductase [Paracoccaceae bacterium]|nr:NAD(P)-dependent oxidoreductase [Paracoccaceae bacterium]